MPYDYLACPRCGEPVKHYRNPLPTVDIIIETAGGIVLIERKNEPTAGHCRGIRRLRGNARVCRRSGSPGGDLPDCHQSAPARLLLGPRPGPAAPHHIHRLHRHGKRHPPCGRRCCRRCGFSPRRTPHSPLFRSPQDSGRLPALHRGASAISFLGFGVSRS